MFTLYTLPNCPRCDMVKNKFDELGIEYEIGTDEARANEYSAFFWPIMFGENDTFYQFPDILSVIAEAETAHILEENPNYFTERAEALAAAEAEQNGMNEIIEQEMAQEEVTE